VKWGAFQRTLRHVEIATATNRSMVRIAGPAWPANLKSSVKDISMLLGFGWCVLRTSREAYRNADLESVDDIDEMVDIADRRLWDSYRQWMGTIDEPWLKWEFYESLNNHQGLLQFCVSRNHRSSNVWDMLNWIVEHGPGSFGLFYVHDDEDGIGNQWYGRGTADYSNVFRVHRLANGSVTELADPFLSPIIPFLNPDKLA
jgi:Immunity protein 7